MNRKATTLEIENCGHMFQWQKESNIPTPLVQRLIIMLNMMGESIPSEERFFEAMDADGQSYLVREKHEKVFAEWSEKLKSQRKAKL